MSWYAAHIIQYVKFLDGIQDRYWVYENVVLVEADSVDAARAEATRIGQTVYDDDGTQGTHLNDRPALLAFAGIRKLVQCENMSGEGLGWDDEGFRPTHGTEITYSHLEVDSAEAFDRLLQGESVAVIYEESDFGKDVIYDDSEFGRE